MTLPTIVSYYSPRPDEYGARAHSYDEAIACLEASCARLGLRHVLLTEKGNEDHVPTSTRPASSPSTERNPSN